MRSPYLDALLNPLNLVMLALAVAGGLCAAWWLFPPGLVLWGVMVLVVANDPVLRLNYKLQARSAALAQRFQAQFDKVTRSQVRLFNAIQHSRRPLRDALTPVHDEIEALTDKLYDLCQRMTGPENYYNIAKRDSDLEGERALAVLALESTTDPAVKKEKQEALTAIDDRIQQLKNLATVLDRVEAHLTSVNNEMASWLAEIARLQALPAKDAPAQARTLISKIGAQGEQIKGFDAEVARLP
jgi:predicted  nucleic acid-binding Zn-ribbon protein